MRCRVGDRTRAHPHCDSSRDRGPPKHLVPFGRSGPGENGFGRGEVALCVVPGRPGGKGLAVSGGRGFGGSSRSPGSTRVPADRLPCPGGGGSEPCRSVCLGPGPARSITVVTVTGLALGSGDGNTVPPSLCRRRHRRLWICLLSDRSTHVVFTPLQNT